MYVRRREKLNEEDGVELLHNQSIILVTDLLCSVAKREAPVNEASPELVHQPPCDMQPLFRCIIWYGAAVGQDQFSSFGLGYCYYNFVIYLCLSTVSDGAAFGQAAHEAFICHG